MWVSYHSTICSDFSIYYIIWGLIDNFEDY